MIFIFIELSSDYTLFYRLVKPDEISGKLARYLGMKVRQKGKWFGYGRILGFHNPFGSDLLKARDPFINLNTLARLSRSSNDFIRQAIDLMSLCVESSKDILSQLEVINPRLAEGIKQFAFDAKS